MLLFGQQEGHPAFKRISSYNSEKFTYERLGLTWNNAVKVDRWLSGVMIRAFKRS